MTLSFMCNLCERIHTPFYGGKKSQAQLLFLVSTRTEQKLSKAGGDHFALQLPWQETIWKKKNGSMWVWGRFQEADSLKYLDSFAE